MKPKHTLSLRLGGLLSSFLFILAACSSVPPSHGAQVRLSFDANNNLTEVSFFAQRKAKAATWPTSPGEIVAGAGSDIGDVTRTSGTVTATRTGNLLATSADFFTSDDVGKEISFTGGAVDRIVSVAGPRSAQTAAAATAPAATFSLRTDRVELVDVNVPSGVWTYRVAARSLFNDLPSPFSNETEGSAVQIFAPGKLQTASLEVMEIEVAVIAGRWLRAVVVTYPDGSRQITWS